MVLVKQKIVFKGRLKPIRFRFVGNVRLGFRNNKVVEVTQFKQVKRQR